jgi:hypothetical protein
VKKTSQVTQCLRGKDRSHSIEASTSPSLTFAVYPLVTILVMLGTVNHYVYDVHASLGSGS